MDGWTDGGIDGQMGGRMGGWVNRCPDGPTCCHKEDSSTEQDVVPGAVDSSDADTQAAQHQQDGAEDGKQAGGSHDTCSHELKCIALNVHNQESVGSQTLTKSPTKLTIMVIHFIKVSFF